jgi:immune inhibitor A
MRRHFLALLFGALALVLSIGVGASVAASGQASANDPAAAGGTDNLTSPLAEKQNALRAKAFEMQAKGQIPKDAKVGKVAKGQYVELTREGEDSIWTVLGEFGTQVNPTYGGTAGPQKNAIPEPDRKTDNTTIWTDDFSKGYYENLLFGDAPGTNSMRNWYIEQSSGRYAVNGEVTDWVQVPFNEANYGANYCGGIVCARTWLFVRDSLTAWYNAQIAAGKSAADINADLAKFDKWDRYDYDDDGNFNEPDGYIDHFQSIHAGVGEETGGGAQGTNAIWSHRWYAFYTNIGVTGPAFNKYGGIQVGSSNYWVGDYTIEPENGGVGVFSHEFGHDLGLPDEYDTSGNTGGAENSTGFWTNWSSGSYGNNGDPAEGIGDRPFHASSWDKLFLGWLNYEVVRPGDKQASIKLGPAEANTKQAQAAIVLLPDKQVTVQLGAAATGSKYYYSGTGDDRDVSMTKSVTLPAGSPSLTAQVRYNIEQDWDYAYLTVNGTPVATNLSTTTSPNGQNFGQGITGVKSSWTPLTADLSAYAGQTVTIGFRYWTDGAQQGQPGANQPAGFQVDEIAVGGSTDGAEATPSFTLDGFRVTTGTETQSYLNFYVAENRQYLGYDAGLKTGPYNFGGAVGPNWAERFPYQDGMLVWYYDTSQSDNNVGDHPGSGLILPIDAHPGILHWSDGTQMRPRIQSFDSTFGLEKTDSFTLWKAGVPTQVTSQPAVPVFDDMQTYYTASDPSDAPSNGRYQASWNSVKHPHTGTQIRITSVTPGGFMQVQVTPPAK